MNSIQKSNPTPKFRFWPFNWGIKWYHPNKALYYLIHTFEFVNIFEIKICHCYFREEIDASVISVLDIRRIFFYVSQGGDSNRYLIFKSGNSFQHCEIWSSQADIHEEWRLSYHTVNQHTHVIRQNHSNAWSEYIQTNRLLQILWTDPATLNHTLKKLRQLCYILEVMKRLNDSIMQLCSAWWRASEVPKR